MKEEEKGHGEGMCSANEKKKRVAALVSTVREIV
jgi:hypothetical protein